MKQEMEEVNKGFEERWQLRENSQKEVPNMRVKDQRKQQHKIMTKEDKSKKKKKIEKKKTGKQ